MLKVLPTTFLVLPMETSGKTLQ